MDKTYCGNCGADVTCDMNFCPKCGAPFKTTALPTPIYSSRYSPTNQPLPNRTAPIPMLALNAFLLGFLGFFTCWLNDGVHHLSLIAIFLVTAYGVLVGFYPMYKYTSRQLRALEEKGEYVTISPRRATIYAVIAIVATIAIAALLLTYVPPNPPSYWYLTYNFLYPIIVIIPATQAVMFSVWQKKNHKWILWEKRKLVAIQPYYPNYVHKF